jgi:hypothetical protein
MTLDQFLFVLSGPLLGLVAVLITLWLAHLQDAREDRRRARRAVPGE